MARQITLTVEDGEYKVLALFGKNDISPEEASHFCDKEYRVAQQAIHAMYQRCMKVLKEDAMLKAEQKAPGEAPAAPPEPERPARSLESVQVEQANIEKKLNNW